MLFTSMWAVHSSADFTASELLPDGAVDDFNYYFVNESRL